ncbi:hypothetical protein [Sphingomonas xinjiangensis]|uniref:Uncharacterized protein n=1 Tax=Sphingomonas xinjiangensis TaxID=643568 RepID=A0A840YSK5_9SPHN|nr:hypothetical protein [Sphingomonas xinjiangensis]MBB5712633.1 hypothetical protein [Sphingomonas xinjiangensis]
MADLKQMVRRQRLLADFGDFGQQSDDLDAVLMEACRLFGDALGTDLAKVMEIEANSQTLFVRASVGWQPGVVGALASRIRGTRIVARHREGGVGGSTTTRGEVLGSSII